MKREWRDRKEWSCGERREVQPHRHREATLCIVIAVCLALVGSEANFTLAPTSRLPRWFRPADGMRRSDVTVSLDYYVMPWGRSATFKLWTSDGRQLDQMNCSLRGVEPTTLGADNATSTTQYEVATGRGIVEIIEHRGREARFSISDDPAVAKGLNVTR